MENTEPSRLADMDLVEAATARADMRVSDISGTGDAWVVIVDGLDPVAAVSTDVMHELPPELSLRVVMRERPPAVIAHADASVAKSLISWAFTQMPADGVAMVVDDAGRCRVWAGEDLAEVRDWAGRRSAIDTRLPSDEIHIPKVCRSCGFMSGERLCTAVVSFAEFPDPLPDCPNLGGLTPHRFVW